MCYTPPAAVPGESAALRWPICRSNACGHYILKGKLEVCSLKRCNGRTYLTPIQGLVEGLGCPEKHW
jgi:hypothetical protein